MRIVWFFVFLFCVSAQAQVPRNASGLYEYASNITVTTPTDLLGKKARKFFNKPFLIHWDSVGAPSTVDNITIVKAKGHIKVDARQWSIFSYREVDVCLDAIIEVKNGGYHYSFTNFRVNQTPGAAAFRLEQRPEEVREMIYHQLLRKTHERITYTVGWLKNYMEESESL